MSGMSRLPSPATDARHRRVTDHASPVGLRASRTRAAIVAAFTALAFERRYESIRVADLIARAGVGRSTFYEHFAGKDEVLLETMQPVLLALATAASGRAARTYVRAMVEHLWDRRSIGRPILGSREAAVIQRRLAQAIQPHAARAGHDEGGSLIRAHGVAAAQLAMLKCWLAGQATSTVDSMTDGLIACSRLLEADRS